MFSLTLSPNDSGLTGVVKRPVHWVIETHDSCVGLPSSAGIDCSDQCAPPSGVIRSAGLPSSVPPARQWRPSPLGQLSADVSPIPTGIWYWAQLVPLFSDTLSTVPGIGG